MDTQNAKILLADIKQCAVKADIYKAWFISFGTLLGAVRPTIRKDSGDPHYIQGVMEHDDDMDIGIFGSDITAEQEAAYLAYLKEAGCFNVRENHQFRTDTSRHVWFTLRREEPPAGTKCCHWMFFEHNGFMWHSKGADWLDERKFPSHKYPHLQTDAAMGKGVIAEHLKPGSLVEVEMEGEKYNIPADFGYCLDAWYPNWVIPRTGGASATEYILKVGKWEDKSTWRIF